MVPRLRQLSVADHLGLWAGVPMTVLSAVMIVDEPVLGTLGLLLFGGGCAVILADLLRSADAAGAGISVPPIARGDIAGYQDFLGEMALLRGRRAVSALAEMGGCVKLMDGLFFHARGRELAGLPGSGLEGAGGGPMGWALASLHPDGRVREAAVAAMARAPRPEFVPFLVERAVDHIAGIRSAALAVLRGMPADESVRVLIARSHSRVTGRAHAAGITELLEPRRGRFRQNVVPVPAPRCCGRDRTSQPAPCLAVARQQRQWAGERQ